MPIRIFIKAKELLEDTELDAMEKELQLMALLLGVDYDELLELPMTDIQELYPQLDFLNDFKADDVTKIKHIVLNNVKYDVILDTKKFSVAQYVDFQTYVKEQNRKMGELLSTILIPHGKKYNEGYDIVNTINDIYDYLPITTANAILFFFTKKLVRSINRTLTYWGLVAMMMMPKQKKKINQMISQLKETHGSLLSMLYQK